MYNFYYRYIKGGTKIESVFCQFSRRNRQKMMKIFPFAPYWLMGKWRNGFFTKPILAMLSFGPTHVSIMAHWDKILAMRANK